MREAQYFACAEARPARPISSSPSASLNSSTAASAIASVSPTGKSLPVTPSSISSGTPPTRVPTIGTRVGGVPELIEDGVTGRLFPVGDTDAMAEAAVELLSDADGLEEMGRAGRASAQAKYCASRIIPLYEKYYEEVLAR